MSQSPLSLEEELSLRRTSEEVWEETWGRAGPIAAKKAFIEGHFMGMACGVLAVRATHKGYAMRSQVTLLQILWWMCLALIIGMLIGQALPCVFHARS